MLQVVGQLPASLKPTTCLPRVLSPRWTDPIQGKYYGGISTVYHDAWIHSRWLFLRPGLCHESLAWRRQLSSAPIEIPERTKPWERAEWGIPFSWCPLDILRWLLLHSFRGYVRCCQMQLLLQSLLLQWLPQQLVGIVAQPKSRRLMMSTLE